MNFEILLPFLFAILIIAFLYSSVGHAGASGYIAVMALFGFAPAIIKPTALVLNILVASITSWQFMRAKHFSTKLFLPFALSSVPFAYIGGMINLPAEPFHFLIGCTLLYSAIYFFIRPIESENITSPPLYLSIPAGMIIGFFSGLIGVGGGIFLTPILLFFRWGKTKTVAAVSALFILINSISGLAGNIASTRNVPDHVTPILIAAVCGGIFGSYYGSNIFSVPVVRRSLAIVLIVAGLKLIAL